MNPTQRTRPKMVWVISLILGLMAASQLALMTFALSSSNTALANVAASASGFEWLMLYVLAAILLTSMVFLFRLQRRAASWFAGYIGLSSWVVWGYALAPKNPPYFDELVSLGGMAVALGVLGYILRLRKRDVLS